MLRIRIRSDPVFLGHPDPDPGKYQIRIRILYSQKDPCDFNFSRYIKLSKVQVSSKYISIFDLKGHNMLRFGNKYLFC